MPRPGTPVVDPRMLPGVRAAVTGSMVDECRISGPGTGSTYNPATKTSTRTAGATKHEGATYLQAPTDQPRIVDFGGEATQVTGYVAAVSIDWDDVEVGDTYTVTAVNAHGDPRLVGRDFTISKVGVDTFAAQRILELEEVGRG